MYRVKPGKSQSVVGLIVGGVLLFLGLTVVIPTFGGFGVLWTLIAGVITVYNAVNVFGKKGVSHFEIEKIDAGDGDARDRLIRLNRLKAEGLITEDEYKKRREEILKQL